MVFIGSRHQNKCGYIRMCARRGITLVSKIDSLSITNFVYAVGRYCFYKYAIIRVYWDLAASQHAVSDNGNMPDQPDEPAVGEDEDNALQQVTMKISYIQRAA